MVYRLYVPVGYTPTKKYPIVVALHGIGERGNNNVNQLTLEELVQPWVRDSVQAKFPHFVMVPQCPANLYWWPSNTWDGTRSTPNIGIVQILDSLKKEFSLDTTRFYVTGLSMGGFGAMSTLATLPVVQFVIGLREGVEASLIKNDFVWASKNRTRIITEWTRRYEGKAAPKKN